MKALLFFIGSLIIYLLLCIADNKRVIRNIKSYLNHPLNDTLVAIISEREKYDTNTTVGMSFYKQSFKRESIALNKQIELYRQNAKEGHYMVKQWNIVQLINRDLFDQ